ncbi:hypothetical protein BIU84_11650 [Aeromonas hydrophila]|nr:hypothetical protein BIU84_11650 [Aeromonas hydrophila]
MILSSKITTQIQILANLDKFINLWLKHKIWNIRRNTKCIRHTVIFLHNQFYSFHLTYLGNILLRYGIFIHIIK